MEPTGRVARVTKVAMVAGGALVLLGSGLCGTALAMFSRASGVDGGAIGIGIAGLLASALAVLALLVALVAALRAGARPIAAAAAAALGGLALTFLLITRAPEPAGILGLAVAGAAGLVGIVYARRMRSD